MRWQAPELFDVNNDEAVHNSKASDIYAWSCVCYEVIHYGGLVNHPVDVIIPRYSPEKFLLRAYHATQL